MVSFLRGKLKGELLEKQLCAIMHGVFGTDKREEKRTANWQRKWKGLINIGKCDICWSATQYHGANKH